ncbi:reverse transcriptase domain-containing protein [Tanacetum coccineum]|uniref:Reverse transcriptase domain-containing protein n=1 Tax=Tanacetum coccineum TaxID=301880 RepID=A0ABQ4XKW6_9ASTR
MEELHKPSLIGRGGPIAPTTIPGTDFVLKNHMVQLLRQNCQFHGFKDEDANEHLDKYLSITQFIKQNRVSQDIMNLNLFPFSLSHEAESWFYRLKTHSINTWEEMVLQFLSKYYPYFKALQLRKNILNFQQLLAESVFQAWERFKSYLRKCPDHRILLVDQILTFYHGITMIDREQIMVAAGGGKQIAYKSQNLQHQPGPGHPHTIYYSDSDESDEDEPSEVEKSKINPFIRGPSGAFLIGDKEIKFNPPKDIDDPVPILRVSKKPLVSLYPIQKTFDMTITNPLFDFDSEFTLNSDNPIFVIQNEESDESETETIMKEVKIHSSQSTAQIPPPYEGLKTKQKRYEVAADMAVRGGSLTWQYEFLTAMAYSSSSLSEVELSSSLDSFLAFKAIDILGSLLLFMVSKSFLITSS